MDQTLQTVKIAQFAHRVQYEDIGMENIDQLKRHLLDSLGSLFQSTCHPCDNIGALFAASQ